MNKHPKRGYENNPRTLNTDVDYEKVQMKHDFENQYEYFSEDIDEQFTEPLLDELYINMFVDSKNVHNKVTGILIIGLFSVMGSTPKTW